MDSGVGFEDGGVIVTYTGDDGNFMCLADGLAEDVLQVVVIHLAAFQAVGSLEHGVGGLFQMSLVDVFPSEQVNHLFVGVLRPDLVCARGCHVGVQVLQAVFVVIIIRFGVLGDGEFAGGIPYPALTVEV